MECSTNSEASDLSTSTFLPSPYKHTISSTPHFKFSNGHKLHDVHTTGVSNVFRNSGAKNHSSDLFASYVRFENSFTGSQADITNERSTQNQVFKDSSVHQASEIRDLFTSINKTENDQRSDPGKVSMNKSSPSSKRIRSFSRVAKRRKTKIQKKTAVRGIPKNENDEQSKLVSLCSNRSSTLKLGTVVNNTKKYGLSKMKVSKKNQLSVPDCSFKKLSGSPGEASVLMSFKGQGKPTGQNHNNKLTRILRSATSRINISKNAHAKNAIDANPQYRSDAFNADIESISQSDDSTSNMVLDGSMAENSKLDTITISSDCDNGLKELSAKNELVCGESISSLSKSKNIEPNSENFNYSSNEESKFFRDLRNNQLKLRSGYVSSNVSISPEGHSVPISTTKESSNNSSELHSFENTSNAHHCDGSTFSKLQTTERNNHGINIELGSQQIHSNSSQYYGDVSSEFYSSSAVAASGMSSELQSSQETSKLNLEITNESLPTQALSTKKTYAHNVGQDRRSSQKIMKSNRAVMNASQASSNISNEGCVSLSVSSATTNSFSRLQENNLISFTNDHVSIAPSNNSTELYGSLYASNTSANANSVSGISNLTQGEPMDGSTLTEVDSTERSKHFGRVLRRSQRKRINDLSNTSESSENKSNYLYGSYYLSNSSASPVSGLQENNNLTTSTNTSQGSISSTELNSLLCKSNSYTSTNSVSGLTNQTQEEFMDGSTLTKVDSTERSKHYGQVFRRYKRKSTNDLSNESQSSENNSTNSHGSYYLSNTSSSSISGLQENNLTTSMNTSQGDRLGCSTLAKAESTASNSDITTKEGEIREESSGSIGESYRFARNSKRRLRLANKSKHSNNILSQLDYSGNKSISLLASDEGKEFGNNFNATEATNKSNISTIRNSEHIAPTSDDTVSLTLTTTLMPIKDSLKSVDSTREGNIQKTDIVPFNSNTESNKISELRTGKFPPSKFLKELRLKMIQTEEPISHSIVSHISNSDGEPINESAPSDDMVNIQNTGLNSMPCNLPTLKTVVADNSKLNSINVTKRKRKNVILPAIMESPDQPDSEQNPICKLVKTDHAKFETDAHSISLHSGKWRRLLSMSRRSSFSLRSGESL